MALRVEQATLERRRSSSASVGAASVAVALLGEPASLELRSTSASEGVASVAVALLVEQATLELRSSSASEGVASVAVALRVRKKREKTHPKARYWLQKTY